ncbi:MAG: NYN domain-containing protein [Clostridia bacterium]|nr:NYN domain-containing protein [Clostridia bacterium]
MENDNLTIALLIDSENVSSVYMKDLEQKLIAMGKIAYKRVYGNFTTPHAQGWSKLINEFALTPVQQFSYTTSKNSTDSRIVIDAMDILHRGNVNAFCIMSSDSDFTTLAKRLKEDNIYVIGAGEAKTPNSFVVACDRFFRLDSVAETAPVAATAPQTKPAEKPASAKVAKTAKAPKAEEPAKAEEEETVKSIAKSEIEAFVTRLLESKNGTAALEWVIYKIYQQFPQFDYTDYGAKKSYEFFNKKKFAVTQLSSTHWEVALK